MIDRELTEALAWYDHNFGPYEGTGHPAVRVMAEAARWARDFPTDEMVEAANMALDNTDTVLVSDAVSEVLEAVRQVMFGEESK